MDITTWLSKSGLGELRKYCPYHHTSRKLYLYSVANEETRLPNSCAWPESNPAQVSDYPKEYGEWDLWTPGTFLVLCVDMVWILIIPCTGGRAGITLIQWLFPTVGSLSAGTCWVKQNPRLPWDHWAQKEFWSLLIERDYFLCVCLEM